MPDPRTTARRFRSEAGVPQDVPVSPERLLPRLYPVSTILLPGLCVAALREWLARHGVAAPGLAQCRDRRLRGAIVAWKGQGLLCADLEDGELERRFTLAHEAGHFLQDHYYPRQDLLARFGARIQPVLDGLRQPTAEERVDALLGRTRFTLYTHLLDREAGWSGADSAIDVVEDDADGFACEVLAPEAALLASCPGLRADEEGIATVRALLAGQFGLPAGPAARYARRFVARHGKPVTILHRLGLA